MKLEITNGCCDNEYRIVTENWNLVYWSYSCGGDQPQWRPYDGPDPLSMIQRILDHFIKFPDLDDVEVLDGKPKPTATEIINAIEAWIWREKSCR